MNNGTIHPGVPLSYGLVMPVQLAGMDQAWYSRVQGISDRLLLLDNKLFAMGEKAWDFVAQQAQAKKIVGVRDSYATVKAATLASIKDVVGQDPEKISEEKLVLASKRLSNFEPQAALVVSLLEGTPEASVVAEEQAALNKVIANLPPSLSPTDEGRTAFYEEMANRVAGLSFDCAKILLPVAVVGGAIWFFSRKRG